MHAPIMRGKVYLMGAGAGDPDLLTAEAVTLLRAAEVVLHDDAVSPEVLELVSVSAQVRNVDKLIESEVVSRDKVLSLLISAAHEGRQAVRLKTGDALSPESVAEEIEVLVQANVDFEVIAGAKTAMAAVAGNNSSLGAR
jgi:siroheme synthase